MDVSVMPRCLSLGSRAKSRSVVGARASKMCSSEPLHLVVLHTNEVPDHLGRTGFEAFHVAVVQDVGDFLDLLDGEVRLDEALFDLGPGVGVQQGDVQREVAVVIGEAADHGDTDALAISLVVHLRQRAAEVPVGHGFRCDEADDPAAPFVRLLGAGPRTGGLGAAACLPRAPCGDELVREGRGGSHRPRLASLVVADQVGPAPQRTDVSQAHAREKPPQLVLPRPIQVDDAPADPFIVQMGLEIRVRGGDAAGATPVFLAVAAEQAAVGRQPPYPPSYV